MQYVIGRQSFFLGLDEPRLELLLEEEDLLLFPREPGALEGEAREVEGWGLDGADCWGLDRGADCCLGCEEDCLTTGRLCCEYEGVRTEGLEGILVTGFA